MTTQFSAVDIDLTLNRYPAKQASNLQAWDAADEHLLKHLVERKLADVPTAIINDSFGALSTALLKYQPSRAITIETDAKTSQLGTLHNFECNGINATGVQWCNSRELLPASTQLVLMKLPKNLNYFAHQLDRLSQTLPQGTQVLIGAKAKSINKSLLAVIAKHLGQASASLAWKKTRVISCISDGVKRPLPSESRWTVPEYQLTLSNLSNVFAANKLDIGARIMLENMPAGDFKSVIDLGCGNGVLGLRAKQRYPDAQIHFVDDSEMAIASAQQNWQLNGHKIDGACDDSVSFNWDDCLTHLDAKIIPDLVLCNPPFHQGEAITDHIAWQMFLDAYHRLDNGGILHVVGNRHLAYHVKLKRIFHNCTTIAANGKFVILQAQKRANTAPMTDNTVPSH
ncbi:methyltransferase [Shewanella colwelliana]|uniref:methyltransferase n=1 Tax=Shewanella colwelliana TaxID=23 RepID=UPI003D01DF71